MIQAKQGSTEGAIMLLRYRISARTILNIGDISVEQHDGKQEMLKSISLCLAYKQRVTVDYQAMPLQVSS